jgi:hypothetical protein
MVIGVIAFAKDSSVGCIIPVGIVQTVGCVEMLFPENSNFSTFQVHLFRQCIAPEWYSDRMHVYFTY